MYVIEIRIHVYFFLYSMLCGSIMWHGTCVNFLQSKHILESLEEYIIFSDSGGV